MRNKAGAAASPPRGPESRKTAENRAFWAPDRAPGPLRHGARSERRDIERRDGERRDIEQAGWRAPGWRAPGIEQAGIEQAGIEPQASSPRHRAGGHRAGGHRAGGHRAGGHRAGGHRYRIRAPRATDPPYVSAGKRQASRGLINWRARGRQKNTPATGRGGARLWGRL